QPSERYVPVEVGYASIQTLVLEHKYSGRVLPSYTSLVFPRIMGKTETVLVKVGDLVDAGDVLFSLEKVDVSGQVEQARLALQAANANLSLARQQQALALSNLARSAELLEEKLQLSADTFARNRTLYEAGALSLVQFQQAELMYREEQSMLRAQIEQAEFAAGDGSIALAEVNVKQAQLAYSQAQDALGNTRVTASSNGVVSVVNVQPGDYVSTAQPAIVIVGMDAIIVQVDVSQMVVNSIFPDMPIKALVSAADAEVRGTVYSVSPVPSAQTGLYPVTVLADNPGHVIKPGMFAELAIELEARDNVLVIDSRAVVERHGKQVVFVVEADRAIAVEVQTGLESGGLVELVSGITVTSRVVVRGQQYLQHNSRVEIVREQ
ncbi:MAG TPA: efflux RND transporter periplasmic adaptor subunit, partial [Bacillota bacterium]|nr:efflux RND transporter periplasmic adaptor subunit [Bacillota bacterium]